MMTVTLSQDMWNSVLLILAEHPYKVTAPLIQAITKDLRGQMEPDTSNVEQMRPGA
jgi:hypothetical protein